ncbi:ap2/erf domain-containing transcription factor [Trifolium pratense]|uniref:Ap2/erf domain-containing transcription factor n=1 Tax=Trifolium pratense TaxID=57577 RepID=A0A2K3NB88_TRIPR|nr:dehydration-responsive element-binding protein 1A-like [Trifolium pratense]PNY00297.1 ap2/erf domain-containing transcription factor [Trifolium pratense]
MFPTNNSSSSSDMSLSNSEGSHWMTVPNEEMQLAATTPKKRAGRKKFKETRHPIYRGVRKRNNDKWVCEMREPNKKTKIWLGTFPTVEMAARAHDVASMALRGRYACLNFADSVWRLPKPVTNEVKDIQKAATEAAELFRPEKTLMTNDNDNNNNMAVVAAAATEEQSMLCPEEEDVGEMNMQEMWRNMALLSPTHSFEYHYEDNTQDFQDEEVSLWNF